MNWVITIIFVFLYCINILSQTKMIITRHSGEVDSINLSDVKSISFNTNLAANGDFENSFGNWILIGDTINPYHPNDPGRAAFAIEDGAASINIINQGISIWSIMLYQQVNFEKNATYSISFDAKADYDVEIISNVVEDGGAWAVYSGDHKFMLTNEMKTYSYEFKMPVGGMALFQFCLGTIGTGKMYFDNVVIRKL